MDSTDQCLSVLGPWRLLFQLYMYNSEEVDFQGPVRFLVFIHQFNSHLWASCNVPGLYLVLEASGKAVNQHLWSLPHHTPLFLWESKQDPAGSGRVGSR